MILMRRTLVIDLEKVSQKSKEVLDLYEEKYMRVFEFADKEFHIKILKFKMADLRWPNILLKIVQNVI